MLAPGHTDNSYGALRRHLGCWRQSHVLCWWQDLSPAQRRHLLRQIKRLDLRLLQHVFQQAARNCALDFPSGEQSRPTTATRPSHLAHLQEPRAQAAELGVQALQSAHVAVVLAATGKPSRLNFGPQGTFIGESGKTLFQIHAENVLRVSRRFGVSLPLFIMTEPNNDAAMRQFFAQYSWFGLDRQQVTFFQQGTMPALDRHTGKLLLAEKHRLATNPNGRGGVLQALVTEGHLDNMRRRGIQYLCYCQVDDPLNVVDEEHLGLHIDATAEISLQVRKSDLLEKLDILVEVDGKLQLMHNQVPQQLAQRMNARGEGEYCAGRIGLQILNV